MVPPFPGSVAKLFKPGAPFLKRGKLFPLLAFKDGKPVGRIAAIVNEAHNRYYQDQVGFFGFFDFVNDLEVAQALLTEAASILRKEGLTTLRGPYSPSSNDECGLLVEGFNLPPMIMMPYNPAFYEKIYEQLGLVRVRELYAYYLRSDIGIPKKLGRVVERVKKRSGIQFRNIDLRRMDDELRIIEDLYNSTLKRNWGFVPVTYEELQFASEDLKQIVQPELVMIAEKEGKAIGFSMILPNINEFLLRAKKHRGLLRVLNFVWSLKMRSPKEARLAVLGVKPEYENLGVPAVFYFESIQRSRKKIVGGELSWIEESNTPMIRSLEMMGAKKYKTYRIYEAPT
ncbi:MAG: N-acetyltransferase [Pseudomonadota bacterium]